MPGARAGSANAELALLLAGTEERRRAARERIAELAASADPGSLTAYLAERRILALIGARLAEQVPEAPAQLREAAAAAADRNRLEAMAVEGMTQRLAARLEEQDIAVLALKGPRLARALHGDPGLRAAHDVDLLVPTAHLDQAVAVTRDEGYLPPRDPRRAGGLPELHFELTHPRLPPVELHWRVHWYESRFSQDALARSVAGDDGLRHPPPADELAMLLLFYARDGFHGLRHAADIAAWWDWQGVGQAAAGLLDEHAARYPDLAPALRAAAVSAELHAGVPGSALLSDARRLGRRGRLAVALADWAAEGDRDQLAANIALVDGLLSPPSRTTAFVRRRILTPASELAGADERVDGLAALRLRGAHAAKTVVRFGLAFARVRGGRAWRPLPRAARSPRTTPAPAS